MGCGPLPDRVKNALFYTIDTLNDNMSLWRWLSTYMQQDMKRATEFDTKAAFCNQSNILVLQSIRPWVSCYINQKIIAGKAADLYGSYSMVIFN